MYAFKKKKVNHKCSAKEIRGKNCIVNLKKAKGRKFTYTLFLYMVFTLYLINLYNTVQFIYRSII